MKVNDHMDDQWKSIQSQENENELPPYFNENTMYQKILVTTSDDENAIWFSLYVKH